MIESDTELHVVKCYITLHEFAAALFWPVHFLSPDQQAGIHWSRSSGWLRTI